MTEFYSGKRVLVAGGAGFIGGHLVGRLVDAGAMVIVLDDFSTGSADNLSELAGTALQVVKGDAAEGCGLRADIVFNLACPASPIRYQLDPIQTWKSSVLGTLAMLEFCETHGARLIQTSTSEVYGDPLVHPQKESYWGNVNPGGPRACYDEGKRAAETIILDYQRHRGVDARIARIFNTYGPQMAADDGRVVSTFIVQALRGEDLTVFGEGNHTRSFCYVSDMVEGLLRLGAGPGLSGRIVNLGNPQEVTVLDLAQQVLRMTGSSSRVVHKELPQDDPSRRLPDIGKARTLLAWAPKVRLEDGLAATIGYFSGIVAQAAYPLDARVARA